MRRIFFIPALVGAILAGLMVAVYLALIRAEDPAQLGEPRILFVAGLLAATSAAGMAGALLGPSRAGPRLLVAAAVGLLAVGTLAILSIGIFLLAAGSAILLSGVGAVAAQPESRSLVLVSAAGSVAAVAVGFALT